ncbi:MAG: helix-turn-helix domain-containing protein [Treponemataceae bacterium]|nr:helix-turn-helix domain-containing protein [Treponemataceae bacterium]
MNETVKRKIEERLKALNMTQRELALKLGVNEVTVSRWLNGERSLTIETLDSIASALDTTASYLLANNSQPKEKSGMSTGLKVTFGVIFGLVIAAVAAGLLSKDEKDKIVDVLKNGEDNLQGGT